MLQESSGDNGPRKGRFAKGGRVVSDTRTPAKTEATVDKTIQNEEALHTFLKEYMHGYFKSPSDEMLFIKMLIADGIVS